MTLHYVLSSLAGPRVGGRECAADRLTAPVWSTCPASTVIRIKMLLSLHYSLFPTATHKKTAVR